MTVQGMSESVYVAMCHKIGTPQQVTSRRELEDISEVLITSKNWNSMLSGSAREGFRLLYSDRDIMYWSANNRVIWDLSQSEFYNRQNLILCDSSESRPGFTLLSVPLQHSVGWDVILSCVWRNGGLYISSSKYRERMKTFVSKDVTIHGPCSSGTYGTLKFDEAHCFVGDFWPPSASLWIDRCHSWPPPHVANDIIRNGCHFVAIGHKLGNNEDIEWRISFSQAEYKLAYSMNHTQFLTYGLLKLFLKEIIHNGLGDEDDLLCSYHMKTAIFWTIQQNTLLNWCPQNLLIGFWVCFKLLLKWVYEGIAPNFFIPENNMFLTKINGNAQTTLFRRLYGLYEEGIAMLLHSSSIRSSIIDVLCNPRLTVSTDEHNLISEAEFDVALFNEIDSQTSDLQNSLKILHTVEQYIVLPLSHYHVLSLQKQITTTFQCIAFILHNRYTSTSVNKQIYIADKISCHMLKLAAKFGCISDMLYIAMYYYKTRRYKEALSVIEMTKVKFAQSYLVYKRCVDQERYTEAVGGQSLSAKMRHTVADDIQLDNSICYINELLPEQRCGKQNRKPSLRITPFVLLNMLEFLNFRYVDRIRAQTALDDLQVLVRHDQGLYVPELHREISWEILGICQQITGNHQAALFSYQQSLRQEPFKEIQTATKQRIHDIHFLPD